MYNSKLAQFEESLQQLDGKEKPDDPPSQESKKEIPEQSGVASRELSGTLLQELHHQVIAAQANYWRIEELKNVCQHLRMIR